MAEQYENHLPHNWIKLIMCVGNTLEEAYVNPKTGMQFFSKEEYRHFVRGIIENRPPFIDPRKAYDTIFLFHELEHGMSDGASTSGTKTT